MKKEVVATLTIILLFTGAMGNLIHLNRLMNQISTHINYSQLYCSLEDYEAAHTETAKAQQCWDNAKSYTHVFIRHSEIEKLKDVFFDIQSAIQNREGIEADNLLQKLQYYVDNLTTMEQLSIGSVF